MHAPDFDGEPPLATVTCRQTSDHAYAWVTGEIDMSNAAEVRADLLRLVHDHTVVLTVDLSRVSFIDSTGLSELVRLRRAAAERAVDVRLVAPHTSTVARTLLQFGAPHLLPLDAPPSSGFVPAQYRSRPE